MSPPVANAVERLVDRSAIYDRDAPTSSLERALLFDRTSAAVVGAHRVGKTHLLDLLQKGGREILQRRQYVFAWVQPTALFAQIDGSATGRRDGHISAFLRSIWLPFVEHLEELVEQEAAKRETLELQLASVKERWANANAIVVEYEEQLLLEMDPIQQRALDKKLGGIRMRRLAAQQEMESTTRQIGLGERLKRIAQEIRQGLDTSMHTARAVRWARRLSDENLTMVVIIDDFHELVRHYVASDKDLSEHLLEYLRAYLNQRSAVLLVALPGRPQDILMDMFKDVDAGRAERWRNLVNSFRNVRLPIFGDEDSLAFINWLAAREGKEPGLNETEVERLAHLGGGVPILLMELRDAYERHRATGRDLNTFVDQHAYEACENVCNLLWERLSPQHKQVIRRIVAGEDLAAGDEAWFVNQLLAEEIIRKDVDGSINVFSPLYRRYVASRTD